MVKQKEDRKKLKEFLDKLEKTLKTGEVLSDKLSHDFIFSKTQPKNNDLL